MGETNFYDNRTAEVVNYVIHVVWHERKLVVKVEFEIEGSSVGLWSVYGLAREWWNEISGTPEQEAGLEKDMIQIIGVAIEGPEEIK